MRLVEEPFITRQSLVSVVMLGQPASDAPIRTLRRHGAVSTGVSVVLRSRSGHLLGRLHLYSSLNLDAARLFRLHKREAAARLAQHAAELERSSDAGEVIRAIERAAADIPLQDSTDSRAQALKAYVEMRKASSWLALDRVSMVREWVTSPDSWLTDLDDTVLLQAVETLSLRAAETRANVPELEPEALTTFVGTVRRMDPAIVQLMGPRGEQFYVPRRDLERAGLATLGQAVTVLREELPTGRVLDSYSAAARLDRESEVQGFEPYGARVTHHVLEPNESAWVERLLASEPRTLPLVPVIAGGGS